MKYRDLKAIFFDVDDTLYSTTQFAEKARRKAIQAMMRVGLKGDSEELYQELLEVIEEFSPNFSQHFNKFLLRLPPQSQEGTNPSVLVAAAVMAYHEVKFEELKIYPDGEDLLKKLSQTNLILGVITSGLAIKQAEKILRLKLLDYINPQAIFISDELGINKPNPKLYRRALETFSLMPNQAMYVGDHPQKDVVPCQKIGIWTALIRRGGKYASIEPEIPSDYVVSDLGELGKILKQDFAIPME